MMAAAVESFAAWLGFKLQALNTDESVFGSYITAILEGDETDEEKVEGLDGILAEISSNDTSELSREILDMWDKFNPADNRTDEVKQDELDEKLVRLMESQSLATTVQRSYTADEKKIREAILAQYSQMSGDEEEEDEFGPTVSNNSGGGEPRSNGLEKNTNALQVAQAVKEKREQAKIDSQKKKDKDKEDREKQKQLKEDKKEKRKTQKGERRR